MPKRSKVSVYEQIRKAHEREGLSVRALARRFHVHRRDVRQALASALPPPRKAAPPRAAPKIDPWKPVIETWLEADKKAPRKQRHSARRVWQRLVEEHGADISEPTVRRFVAEVRARQEFPLAEVAVPQHHPLGEEAEVDFGTATVILAGAATEVQLFIMRLSASGRAYPRAYLNEGQEVFLDGHVRAFEHFGGVPARIRYDNLKAAVEKILRGRDRLESERFVALRSHYGFDSFFCQPGVKGAHEKGGVEGEIGRFRRRHMVPVPKAASMAELNEALLAGAAQDDRRFIAGRRIRRGRALRPGGARTAAAAGRALRLPGGRQLPGRPQGPGLGPGGVLLRPGPLFRPPPGRAGRGRDGRGADGAKVVARHPRSQKGEENLVLDHYLEVLAYKPGALPGATALARARAGGAFTQAHERFWAEARRRQGDRDGTKALIEVLLLHRTMAAGAVMAGMGAALAAGSTSPAVVAIEARRSAEGGQVPVPIGEGLARFDRPKPTTEKYDQLLEASG